MDISTEVAAIQAASEGSELRQPLVGALNKLNNGTLPAVTSQDVGKILKVGANGWELGSKSGFIPITPQDEGKVVLNCALVAQTARASEIIQNGTYDTTENNSVTVNVQSGGGSTSTFVRIWTHTTGGNDASIYVQQYTWDGESLVSLGSPVDVSFWPFYNHEYEYLDFFNSIRIKYGASITNNWEIYSLKDNVFFPRDIKVTSNGNLITYWSYKVVFDLLFAI